MASAARILLVLAGGNGSRIGGAKAMRRLDGRPLIEHVLDAGQRAGLVPVVVAKRQSVLPPGLTERGVRVLIEPETPQHPLLGVCWGLRRLGEPVVVAACDMPYVLGELLGELAVDRGAHIVAPSVEGHLQPTLARYAPASLGALEAGLAEGAPARLVLERAGAVVLDSFAAVPAQELARQVRDIDTIEQLAAARRQSSSRAASSPGVVTGSSQAKLRQT